ncbi:LysR substrate-binding domain-containing protein [Speluncibacter jeojiensis]|uniref:LysR substrate-binding domain-containing protein n=1 Tax=Speluncibacter jeojiensis TaxID=2710754 RepID=A0A9X4M5J6_9ACTN|nr:LysR substrate-binding domain-containing protein [Corynebacteriales bacterium D3-21]
MGATSRHHLGRIRLHLVQAHGEALAQMVRDGRLDLAVMIPPPDDLPSTALGRQRILLHVARSHRLAQRKRVDLAELAGESFISCPPTYHLRTLTDSWCAAEGFVPRIPFETTEFDTIRSFVAYGLGVALLPAAETAQPDVVAIPLSGRRDRAIGLSAGNHRPTPAVARLRAHLEARVPTVLAELAEQPVSGE